jgi:hypothetical protein
MASVKTVYETLRDLVNKDQKGFVTPAMFNKFAYAAQLNVYNRLFDRFKDAHRNSRASFDPGRDKSLFKKINEDLSYFSKTEVITKEGGVFAKPEDISRIISATTFGDIILDQSTRTPIEMCYDEDKIDRILRSNISAPTNDFPIAMVSKDIEVFPQSIQKIRLKYYKIPGSLDAVTGDVSSSAPVYGTDLNLPGDTFDPTNSFDFELPEHYSAMLVIEVAEMIGVNLRDQIVQQYAGTEQVLETKQQTFN